MKIGVEKSMSERMVPGGTVTCAGGRGGGAGACVRAVRACVCGGGWWCVWWWWGGAHSHMHADARAHAAVHKHADTRRMCVHACGMLVGASVVDCPPPPPPRVGLFRGQLCRQGDLRTSPRTHAYQVAVAV